MDLFVLLFSPPSETNKVRQGQLWTTLIIIVPLLGHPRHTLSYEHKSSAFLGSIKFFALSHCRTKPFNHFFPDEYHKVLLMVNTTPANPAFLSIGLIFFFCHIYNY